MKETLSKQLYDLELETKKILEALEQGRKMLEQGRKMLEQLEAKFILVKL